METKWTLDEVMKNIIGKSQEDVIEFFTLNGCYDISHSRFTVFVNDKDWIAVELDVAGNEILSWGVVKR
jgi:hypothetical protein